MTGKTEYLALINPVPGLSEADQRAMLEKFQPVESFTVDKDGAYDQFIGLVRPPRVVLIAYAGLLAEQRGNKDDRPDSMVALKVAIHRKGSYIQEAGGRRSDKHWAAMRKAGKELNRRTAQGRKSAFNAKRGAKRWDDDVTRDEKAAMRELWYVIPGKRTVDDAVAEIKRRFRKKAPGRTVLYREFGDPVMKKR